MSNKDEHKKSLRFQGVELTSATNAFAKNGRAAVGELVKTKASIQSVNLKHAGVSVDKRAGHVFEEFVAGTFNADARRQGDALTTAVTGKNGGFGNDKRVDIKVVKNGRVLKEAQAKCSRNPGRTAVSVSKSQYAGTDRLVPKGQAKRVTKMLQESAAGKANSPNARMRAIGEARAEASTKVTETLAVGKVKSKALSQKDAITYAKGNLSKLDGQIVLESARTEGLAGAKSGLIFGGVMSTAANGIKVFKGEKSLGDAAKDVAKDAAKDACRGAATAVTSELIHQGGKRLVSNLGRSGPMAAAGALIDISVDAYKGQLTVESAAKSVTRAAGGWGGTQGGAAIGTMICPGIGTVIGGVVGGIAGSLLGGMW